MATELGEVLTDAGMSEVLPLPKARVPVVKFVVPETGTKVGGAGAGHPPSRGRKLARGRGEKGWKGRKEGWREAG